MLEKDELLEGFAQILGSIHETEIDDIIANIDLNSNGQIEFSEWLVATAKRDEILKDERLKQAFQYFNKSGNGKISLLELKDVMGSNGQAVNENANLDDQVYKDIIAEVDEDNDGEINYQDFKNMMLKLMGPRVNNGGRNGNFLPFKHLPE